MCYLNVCVCVCACARACVCREGTPPSRAAGESSLCFMPTDKVKDAVRKRRSAEDGHGQVLGLEVAIQRSNVIASAIELDAVRA